MKAAIVAGCVVLLVLATPKPRITGAMAIWTVPGREVCADWVSTQAFWQCVEERRTGKVKHCYRNDPRWRDYFYNEWR